MVLFTCTLRHRGLAALPGVGKQVVLFRFRTPYERHKWVDVERLTLDPLPGAKDDLRSRPRGDGLLPNPRALTHCGSTSPSERDYRAQLVCRGLSNWTTAWPLWVSQAQAAHTTCCCWPDLPWTPPTPCATCAWGKATSCGRAGHHGWTGVTVHPGGGGGRCSSIRPPHLAPSLPSRLCCLASPDIADRRRAIPGAMRAPRSRFRCAASEAARSSSLLPLPCRIHTGVLGGGGGFRQWLRLGGRGVHHGVFERWVWGCGPVGLWAGRGSFAVGMCVGMCGHVCHVCHARGVGLRCRQVGPRMGLLHKPCQPGAGLYGACMGPVWGLCMACIGLC